MLRIIFSFLLCLFLVSLAAGQMVVRNSAGSALVVITQDKKVGIAATAPTGILDVQQTLVIRDNTGDAQENDYVLLGQTGGRAQIKVFGANGKTVGIGYSNQIRQSARTYDMAGIDGSTPYLYIVEQGRVGIGTTTPVEALHVNGGVQLGVNANDQSISGTLRYSGGSIQLYNGSQWISLRLPRTQ